MNTVSNKAKELGRFYNLCRLCSSNEGIKYDIFNNEGKRRQLHTKILACVPILKVDETDILPQLVCNNCVEKLDSFYEFQINCTAAEAHLKKYFASFSQSHLGKEGRNFFSASTNNAESTDTGTQAFDPYVIKLEDDSDENFTVVEHGVLQNNSNDYAINPMYDSPTPSTSTSTAVESVEAYNENETVLDSSYFGSLLQMDDPQNQEARASDMPELTNMTTGVAASEDDRADLYFSSFSERSRMGSSPPPGYDDRPSTEMYDSQSCVRSSSQTRLPTGTSRLEAKKTGVSIKKTMTPLWRSVVPASSDGRLRRNPQSFGEVQSQDCTLSTKYNSVVPRDACGSKPRKMQHFECSYCTKMFKTQKYLMDHLVSHIKKDESASAGPSKSKCAQTPGTSNKTVLSRVIKQEVIENETGESASFGSTLLRNMECYICRRIINNKSTLARHLELHKTGTLYECPVCKKAFSLMRALVRHKQFVHASSYSKKNASQAVKKRVQLNLGKKLFQCEKCKRKFSLKAALVNHRKACKGVKGNKQGCHKCDVCLRVFPFKAGLVRHKQTHIKIKEEL